MTLQHDDDIIKSTVKNAVQTVLQTISYGIFERSEYYLSLKEKAVQAITTTLLFMKDIEKLGDRKSTRLNSSHVSISYAVFCLKKKKSALNSIGSTTIKI